MKPYVSIIIPTRNRSAVLARCLAALPAGVRGLQSTEVIVVDDCSSDATCNVIERFGNATGWPVHCLHQQHPLGANAARNTGLQAAQGEVVVCIDDDVLVTDGWLLKLLAGLSEHFPIVSGPVRLMAEGPVFGKHREEVSSYLSEILVPARGARGEIVPVACNMAAFRWVFDRAQFDENVRPPVEENDWLERTGQSARFVPEACVWHYKTEQELKPHRILASVWRRGGEGGWWLRERLEIPARKRWTLAKRSLRTSLRAFGHAVLRRCWGGVVVGLGELSRALALAGLLHRGTRAPESWR
jgi:glycosyltransferase involved in cell wall biosynthesis